MRRKRKKTKRDTLHPPPHPKVEEDSISEQRGGGGSCTRRLSSLPHYAQGSKSGVSGRVTPTQLTLYFSAVTGIPLVLQGWKAGWGPDSFLLWFQSRSVVLNRCNLTPAPQLQIPTGGAQGTDRSPGDPHTHTAGQPPPLVLWGCPSQKPPPCLSADAEIRTWGAVCPARKNPLGTFHTEQVSLIPALHTRPAQGP